MQQSVINHDGINEKSCVQVRGDGTTELDDVPSIKVVCEILGTPRIRCHRN